MAKDFDQKNITREEFLNLHKNLREIYKRCGGSKRKVGEELGIKYHQVVALLKMFEELDMPLED